jgi:hypothetical protein
MTRRLFPVMLAVVAVCGLSVIPARTQADRYGLFERILDTYVRDGYVYYRALKIERANLDRFIGSLNVPAAEVASWSRGDQQAFWINAYNALILQTVINDYPSGNRSSAFPANSIRQTPGAFQRITHQVGGQSLTLDDLETKIIAAFGDARLVLALGRGATASPRLKSEVYRAAKLETQLADAVKECATRRSCFRIEETTERVEMSAIIGWNQALFEAAAPAAPGPWASRSPVERAVLTLFAPHLFPTERTFLNENHFQMAYGEFDWTLNDLTGR